MLVLAKRPYESKRCLTCNRYRTDPDLPKAPECDTCEEHLRQLSLLNYSKSLLEVRQNGN